MAVINEVVKEEMSGEQGLPREAKNDVICYVELSFPILTKTPGSYLIENIDLNNFEGKHDDLIANGVRRHPSPLKM